MTRTAILTLIDQGKTKLVRTIRLGDGDSWTHLHEPLGIHAPRVPTEIGEVYGLRPTSGVLYPDGTGRLIGAGTRFDAMVIDFGEPVSICADDAEFQPYVTQPSPNAVMIGGGGLRHCIAPRGALRVYVAIGEGVGDLVHERERLSDSWDGSRITPTLRAPFPEASKVEYVTGDPEEIARENAAIRTDELIRSGLFVALGPRDHGMGSGHTIEFQAGREQNARVAIWRAALVMARHRVDCFDRVSGRPVSPTTIDRRNYTLASGWNKSGQLVAFARDKVNDPNGDNPEPRWWNEGPCSYENLACGIPLYTMPGNHNHEHLRRAAAPLEAAVEMWDDPIARIDQRALAWDCLYALHDQLARIGKEAGESRGKGHGELGWRGLAWPTDVLLSCEETNVYGRRIAAMAAMVGTKAGTRGRRKNGYPYSPGAWEKSDAVPVPLPANVEASQSMEETIWGFVLGRAGELDAARLLWDRMFRSTRGYGIGRFRVGAETCILERAGGNVPKFYGVAVNGRPVSRVTQFAGKADYFQWTASALGWFLSRDKAPFERAMLTMGTPYGHVGDTREKTLKILREEGGHEQTCLAQAALEQVA